MSSATESCISTATAQWPDVHAKLNPFDGPAWFILARAKLNALEGSAWFTRYADYIALAPATTRAPTTGDTAGTSTTTTSTTTTNTGTGPSANPSNKALAALRAKAGKIKRAACREVHRPPAEGGAESPTATIADFLSLSWAGIDAVLRSEEEQQQQQQQSPLSPMAALLQRLMLYDGPHCQYKDVREEIAVHVETERHNRITDLVRQGKMEELADMVMRDWDMMDRVSDETVEDEEFMLVREGFVKVVDVYFKKGHFGTRKLI